MPRLSVVNGEPRGERAAAAAALCNLLRREEDGAIQGESSFLAVSTSRIGAVCVCVRD